MFATLAHAISSSSADGGGHRVERLPERADDAVDESEDVGRETLRVVPRIQLRDARGDGPELGVGLLDRDAGLQPRLELEELALRARGWRDRAGRAARRRRPSFDTRGGITPTSVVGMPSSVKLRPMIEGSRPNRFAHSL